MANATTLYSATALAANATSSPVRVTGRFAVRLVTANPSTANHTMFMQIGDGTNWCDLPYVYTLPSTGNAATGTYSATAARNMGSASAAQDTLFVYDAGPCQVRFNVWRQAGTLDITLYLLASD